VIRLYRVLLRLYPASFRERWASEMCAVFAERVAAATGVLAPLRLLGEATLDVVPNAVAAHLEILRQDLRYAGRTLARAPGFVVASVLIVAFGVGANTAAFSVADFVLVRPLPFPEPDRLVRIWSRTPGYAEMELSPPNYRDMAAMNATMENMAAYWSTATNLVFAGAEPERVEIADVTTDLFEVLGVAPLRGRTFDPADTTGAEQRTVVLSEGLWRTRFGADPGVIGRSVALDGEPYEVVGVMPETFRFPTRTTRLWRPLPLDVLTDDDRANNTFEVIGALASGVTVEQARADLERVAAHLEEAHPEANRDTGANAYPLRDDVPTRARLMLLALEGAALCILLLACANLVNLQLARAAGREREIAVRAALGAGRERLLRQMATEGAVLAAIGGAAGVGVAVAAVPLFARLVPTTLPIAEHPSLDLRVLALAGAFTVLTALGSGILPALRVGGRRGLGALREAGRGGGGRRQRVRGALVSVQVASSVVLLVSSGLLARAMWRLQGEDPGFHVDGVVTLRTALPFPRYEPTEARYDFYRRVLDDVRALPGVSGAAYISGLPLVWGGGIWPVVMGGQEAVRDASNSASMRFVSSGYFDAMDIRVARGRDVSEEDRADTRWVAVVSESFARRYWPEQDPIGRRFEIGFDEREVVGVVRDVSVRGLERTSEPQVYLPYRQVRDGWLTWYAPKDLVVRAAVPLESIVPALRRIVHDADPEQPVSDVRTMEEVVAGESATRAAQLRVLGALSAVALLLAGIGIHGLQAFTVSMRSREIGVRLALGANKHGVARMVLRDAMLLALLGTVPGVLVALAAGRAMGALLLGVRPWDPATIAAALALVLASALVGSLIPALRAVRVSPASAMASD
jgi:putative ABC transport system permease protein